VKCCKFSNIPNDM